ncbi:EAL domain-containing protein [Vibrio ostreae]|uniref:EAL domain-containing protein n=1 Tax=Vibrio ostreae TaxID=2841925 RepID=A0A975UBU6_9VIBR|nr:EAL domain-containing protein [Vibrio ostreae]QXO18988.1 EAL domain-containing protein [Vibrio ostreae]
MSTATLSSYRLSRIKKARFYTGLLFIVLTLSSFVAAYQWVTYQLAEQARAEIRNVIEQIDQLFIQLDKISRDISAYPDQDCASLQPVLLREMLKIPGGLSATKSQPQGYCHSIQGSLAALPLTMQGPSIELTNGMLEAESVLYRTDGMLYEVSERYFLSLLDINPAFIKPSLLINHRSVMSLDQKSALVRGGILKSNLYDYSLQFNYDSNMYHWRIIKQVTYYLLIPLMLYVFASFRIYRFLCQPAWLAGELASGIAHQQFKPYIQPIFDSGGRMVGGEILVRWHHPTRGIVGPYEFISIIERGGLSQKLTEALLEQTATHLAPVAKQLPDNFHIAFNISAEQLINDKIVQSCQRFRQLMNAPHINLVLELTEREQAFQVAEVMDTYQVLKNEHVRISIDDFGTGHSSLLYLQMFQADYLKIDKSFIDLIGENELSNHIVNNVLDLARRLNIPTVAEGVERNDQLDYLTVHGVDYFQGYLFSKPVSMETFIEHYCAEQASETKPLHDDI